MDRRRRELSEAGVYHIVMRGNGQSSGTVLQAHKPLIWRCTGRRVALEYLL